MGSEEKSQTSPQPAAGEATRTEEDGRRLKELVDAHAVSQMVGWDFSRLDGRWSADEPWWDFESDSLDALRRTRIGALDVGTGGGERLSTLLSALREHSGKLPRVVATEGWAPNLPIARKRLAMLSIAVLEYDCDNGAALEIPDRDLDLVMARHESYDATEVARVLVSEGRFLTQQVDGFEAPELHDWFECDFLYPEVTAENHVERLREAGMRIDHLDRWEGTMRFADAMALVIYIGLVPWDVPGFTVEDHAHTLLELDGSAPIEVTQRRFRVYATKI